ncbi:MAG: alcohol dehydrogenase [Gammaproteobacteria bacterium]|nr:alcohol dehydrogenase [Gammaproteobacteria bacterium]
MIARMASRSTILRNSLSVITLAVVVAVGFIGRRLATQEIDPSVPDVTPSAELVAQGAYLARAADCVACHTPPGAEAFSGGVAFKLPFGTLYSTNITADGETGIGRWSDDDFVRALHRGVAKDGRNLYPAFPYTSYTAMNRRDAVAIKAYLFSLPAVHARATPNQLPFPFNQRWTLTFWKWMFLDEHRFRPDPTRSELQNRGTYLSTALGHCGECHTPRNILMGMSTRNALAGAEISGWHAYNLTSDRASGLGDWSDEQLRQFLSTGHAEDRGPAAGPMADVVENSTRYLTPQDVQAMVIYLRGLPARSSGYQVPAAAPLASTGTRGRLLFVQACTGCHLLDGEGRQSAWAALRGAHSAREPSGKNVVQVLIQGSKIETGQGAMFMESFIGGYSYDELAAIGNFVIGQFGLHQGTITPEQVRAQNASANGN